ncbi:16S rRNA (cytosine(967)-C(5))-methyltransferase RsmB [Levilactobacillus bambusae]|uniref:16S rRNA (cytosine(967)-C(5))-methyltransferase n=1 Tax=Levilactobacillus bambusae TaxID=2024736 RepID=A0A2V1N2Z3_9LACO|nr:16S rRNA (cytosine(967)-C(5))-methyltransferase RsmB [Levilactobacillus bambusae]PWG00918.1 16S rRNA (cytosine(967)-C(5))-methyltransferase RsmB [Levilactobacillus bambusae]
MSEQTENPRSLAVTALERIQNGAYSNLQLDQMLEKHHLSARDRGLLTTIVYGTIQHKMTLDYYLAPFIKRPQKVQPWVHALLQTAVYQIVYLDRVPKRAVFNETINIAKFRGHEGVRRFVTGVLHAIDRQGLPDVDQIKDRDERLAVTFSVPVWLIQEMTTQFGPEKCESILEVINQPANQSVRANLAVTDVNRVKTALEAEGYEVTASEVAADALLVHGKPANMSDLFSEGFMTIQDESAMLPAEALDIQGQLQILDACAAPGGKTTQMAAMIDGGQVTALDLHPAKVKLIKANAKRLHVNDRVTAMALDARKVDEKFADESFDRILVDAPCSGFGLVRRKPEIRYEKTLQDSENLSQIQRTILDRVAPKLKKNGIMVYSTCTILEQENEAVVTDFLTSHPDFESVRVETAHHLKADRQTDSLTIYPDDFGSDGFFVSAFRRRS